ncbi:cytochrome c oxidase accessory protein FixG [Povalibacter uvarum]|uniref:Cytochrome c oxidase accessory protein FixG n=1 Tax=Povalibacter uvarum TaxID=732238 RepID=A0A841HGU7_9GAMM|nr:cytochrome c oxidase accessory protein CcoG [Povalibacter uvarum]MBB6092137.1 cytochrome c oxidase accessory protein FixG [Povalibacter uvarum]
MAAGPQDVRLYEAQQKIYPREVSGRFNTLRVIAVCVLLGLFYALPWLQWDGHQAILFDLPHRKFHILGLTFFPQDFYLLTWLLVIAALSLFFFTALAGRLWCGYACPQTVWTEIFVWMERLFEGNRLQRMKLDDAPWSARKILRKGGKQAAWLTFAFVTGITFVGYFTPVRELIPATFSASLGGWETFWVLFYGFATYGNAGYMREQVCKYMCPYARFQGAMFDRNTLLISYDTVRGEPRGSRRRGSDARDQGLGDCIDCTLCVQVCPTGIDIRKGLQLECIACAACIDACDDVMDRMQAPRGLIRYATHTSMAGGKTKVARPRTLIYGSVLLLLIIGFGIAVGQRRLIEVDVLRDRNALYRQSADGHIENVYTLRFVNKDENAHSLKLDVRGLEGAEVDTDAPALAVGAGQILSVPVRVRVPAGQVSGGHDIEVVASATDQSGIEVSASARFMAPVKK